MRAAVVRRVQHEHVAAAHRAAAAVDDRLHALAHRAQVHRHVRRVGDQVALGVEQRAREIEPLLDVDRVRGVGERHAHLLGDRHEQVVEDFEQHRVGGRADRVRRAARPRRARARGRRARCSVARQPGSTTVVAFSSRITAGPAMASPGRRSLAVEDRRIAERAVGVDAVRPDAAPAARPRGAKTGAASPAACARPIASTAIASMTSGLPGIRKPYCCRYRRSNSRDDRAPRRRRRDLERRVGAFVLEVQRALARRSRSPGCPARRLRRAPPLPAPRTSARTSASAASDSRASTACCCSARTSASPMP